MSRNLISFSAAALFGGTAALAEVPRVAVDIAPVHSLVARVMAGVGTPDLIVPPEASPHEYSLRPSQATALQEAGVVFWVTPDLTPWLDGALDTLAGEATVVELLGTAGTLELPLRQDALFEAHHHDHGGHEEAAHEDHEDHEDHDHAEDGHEGHDHEDHADEDNHAAGHDHAGEHDPHAWLSPQNGAVWLDRIAATLSEADPANAAAYRANAAAGQQELASLTQEIQTILDPVRDGNFIVFHDAYQYFEAAFDVPASGTVSLSDASDPSPARIAEVQARVTEQNITCVLSEPQFNPGVVASVMEGSAARTGVLDPLGSDLEPGPMLYPDLLRNLARALADCL
ncbi:High-affinity zinc uptake system protein ZnuA precursor (plasmid) [Sulfitobacter sp. THAF37]|uniref:zinc ABC transporter substrate-binding protein n=1 Tax=Sulfitobacter sp. THAF37 TaxID=2587855 RepID=UPI001267DA39|nr:zinc ABC transporter substrate-binding protein [Sulfitobacter sp. THAF37]QFT61104.1 High-affinity zinc uptake system protein ZnuA precursor [Sulfitobacter sp. THAF37]